MGQVLLQCKTTPSEGPCGFCHGAVRAEAGPQLCLGGTGDPVCDGCARRHAPALMALLRLRDAAERVGKIACHGVFPPMLALLDLARAAEEYTRATAPPVRRVG